MKTKNSNVIAFVAIALIAVTMPNICFASSSNMPWGSAFTQILGWVQGPTLNVITILSIIGVGATMMLTQMSGATQMALKITLGLCVAAQGTNLASSLMGVNAGLGF